MKYTSNYSLRKPDTTDIVDIADFNTNVDKIDSEIKKVNDKTNEITSQLEHIVRYDTTINILKLGAKSSNVAYNETTKKYDMFDIGDCINNAINNGYNKIIIPEGDYLIDTTVVANESIEITGYNSNIYCSPSEKGKTIFSLKGSNQKISGLNFFSKNIYDGGLDVSDGTVITSNICAISVLGKDDKQNNVTINNCSGDAMNFFVSVMETENVYINNCQVTDSYFPIFTGFSAKNIFINNCDLECQLDTDKYGHVLYIAHTSENVKITNCRLASYGLKTSNIVKCGSNTGASKNVKVINCEILGIVETTVFYLHAEADLYLSNCIINIKSKGGYSRLMQFGNDSNFLCENTTISLDSFQRFTVEYNLSNGSIIFRNCSLKFKNSVETYCTGDLTAGVDIFKFENCILDYSELTRAWNLMPMDMRNYEIYNSKLIIPAGCNFGLWSGDIITYSKTTSPKCIIMNTIIEKPINEGNTPLFGFIRNDNHTPNVQFSNITCVNCEPKSGSYIGKIIYNNAENDYKLFNNVVNVVIS